MAKKIAAVIAPGDQEVVYEGASTFMPFLLHFSSAHYSHI
jgi:hypothetical protein